ncbi:MAG TPA: SAM-dependent chlorinase/fluorinase [Thermoanaerobaculia bacterium]|nr:SAM-dependent chlorinase/fluorinase [Thermoanaerobaculia bacterium]
MRLLTLLTDFGTRDYYVGAVKGTVLRLAPGTQLVDLGHDLAPGDVEGAAELLAAAAPTFPRGTVHLAVVDPGVGSGRRILAAEAGGQRFVAPDNGLLAPVLRRGEAAEGPGAVLHAVTRQDLFLPGPGATFHGRDRFAPVAAALLRGDHPAALGPPIDDPVPLAVPPPRRERQRDGEVLLGRIARVDRFGNLITDLPAEWVGQGERGACELQVGGHRVSRWVTHYAELPDDEPGVLVGSLGTLEVSLRDDDLAARWELRRGVPVRLVLNREG